MDITAASTEQADTVVDLWVDLAVDQRRHDSRLRGPENRGTIREAVLQRIITDDLLVATVDEDGDGDGDGDGGIVGFVMFTIERGRYEQDGTTGVIENLYVAPEARRSGVGSGLLSAAEDRLVDAGTTAVSIEAMAANDAARQFYRHHGYEPHRVELRKPTENDTA